MKKLYGIVVSLKNKKTAVVKVDTLKRHPKYKKVMKQTRNFQVHYEESKTVLKLGSRVIIEPCRPISALKRFLVVEVN